MNLSKYITLEEAIAKVLSLVIDLAFFSIYILTKNTISNVDWQVLMIHLAIFWLVYEILSFGFYIILIQFSQNKISQPESKIETQITQEIKKDLDIN
jgi:hypothetical protein